ncbi:hypothetical protein ElyMa_006189700 [Elysia marginata]|uniref:Uncharacterized protein n=1 Tax=Elysia marginata TaxID=1093978 RepID=A0AAV4H2S5_9GAST|nr:hypothetical protein ElyMa_006189700 [Elysia marginata]
MGIHIWDLACDVTIPVPRNETSKVTYRQEIVWKSFKHGLKEEDVPDVNTADTCRTVSLNFDRAWAIEEKKSKAKSQKIRDNATNNNIPTVEDDLKESSKATSSLIPPERAGTKNVAEDSTGAQSGRVNVMMVLLRAFGMKFATRQFVKGVFEMTHLSSAILME